MNSAHWRQVTELFHAALSRDADVRDAYVRKACGDDATLLADVNELLAAHFEAGAFGEAALSEAPRSPDRLVPGATLGPYRIDALIGAGGMGEVYKATDTRLDRIVAIKVLPGHGSVDPDRRARFEREAKAVAALAHPNICTLHDVGEHAGSMFLVMEHLDGETLAHRLEKGPLPVEQALTIAAEIADALSAAHRRGIIHRDLKPANVMLIRSGAKLLDFGLAKLTEYGDRPAVAPLTSTPTRTTPLTAQGMIAGTLEYMAPERIEGKPADARTDLWALGAILYEMLTGERAFQGDTAAGLIRAILEREPAPLATVRPLTPPAIDRLVRRCLAKAQDDRPDTARDVANELRGLQDANAIGGMTDVLGRHRQVLNVALWMAGGVMAVAVAVAGVTWLKRPATPAAFLVRTSLDVGPAENLYAGGVPGAAPPVAPGGSRTALTWTPDGKALVFVGRRGGVQQLYIRHLDTDEARPLRGTEDAQVPAVSHDGRWVAFWSGGKIREVPTVEGAPVDLASGIGSPPVGLAWDDRGSLFYGNDNDGRIWQIPVDGTAKPVTTVRDGELKHSLPWPLPGGAHLLYTVRKRFRSWGDEEIVVQTLATGERRLLLTNASDARYVTTGHLVFLRLAQLFAASFDSERLTVRAKEMPVLDDNVSQALTDSLNFTGAGQFAVATTGTLAYVPSPIVPFPETALITVDRHGHVIPLPAPARSYNWQVRVSPDGRQLAVQVGALTEAGLWLYDLNRGTLELRNQEGEVSLPRWSPDGQHLVFRWLTNGRWSLGTQRADGTALAHVLVNGNLYPSSFTPDGRQVVAVRGGDIVMVTVADQPPRVQPVIATPASEQWPALSSDGRWLAYGSDESGRPEIYVRPYPGPGKAELVSIEGGTSPAWHPKGTELFFTTMPDEKTGRTWMMAATIGPGSPLRIDRPRPLFEFRQPDLVLTCVITRCYDVSPDGQLFYAVKQRTPPPLPPVVTRVKLVQNWFEELRTKVPSR